MSEVWAPVAGYEGLYEVSDQGRVRSLRGRHGQGRVLNPALPEDPRSYKAVSLHKNGKRSRQNVHVLVAKAFCGPKPSPRHQVRHLDGDRGSNRAGNLCWGLGADNAADRERHGRSAKGKAHGMYGKGFQGASNPQATLTEDDVRSIRSRAGQVSQRKLAAEFGVTQGVIWRIIHGKAWAALTAREQSQ